MASEVHKLGNHFRADSISIDADAKVTETSEYLTVEPVTVAREGVFLYEDGRAYKPGDELAKAAKFSRMYLSWDHPPLKVITRPQEIKGFADGVRAEQDGKGTKVKGRLTFFKKSLTQDQQELIRSRVRRDVSVGFYYQEDRTPGSWGKEPYDYVQRNFLFDHVASVDHGRCSYPACGIGADTTPTQVQIGTDPAPKDPAPSDHGDSVMNEENQLEKETVAPVTEKTTQPSEDAALTYQQRMNLPDKDFAYISPDGKRQLPIHDRPHVVAALQALQGVRGGVDLPASARAEVKRRVCARAKTYGIKSPYCDVGGDAAVLLRHLREMDLESLVDFHRAIHKAEDFVPEGVLHRAVLFALKKVRP